MTADSVLLHIDGPLARIVFNRPDRLNAMDFDMGARWREVAEQVATDPGILAVILSANGPAFCAGGDVISMATSGASGSDVTDAATVIHAGIAALVGSDKPIVAAVRGAVAGGGLGLMLTADYIVAGEGAKFVSRYANIGLTPDLGVSTLLSAAIGQRRALQLLLQDRTLTATEALEWGLVAEVAADPAARAEEIVAFWLAGATHAFGQAKRLVRSEPEAPFAHRLDDEARTIGAAFDTEASRVRVAAFAKASSKKETR